jgi:hypothetical protein
MGDVLSLGSKLVDVGVVTGGVNGRTTTVSQSDDSNKLKK